ncbi:MAG TPA: hypothetical protein PKN30_17010 [Flavobacteriales bacterium]|nr:hypothetical protein [Flavobacteriales bacterium]
MPFFRWPLDHIFHSADRSLLRLERLPAFGSDHYPMFIELELAPARNNGEKDEAPSAEEEKEVDERIEEGREKGELDPGLDSRPPPHAARSVQG